MSKKIWDMYLEQEANASRLQAEVERLTAEIDNIKQVEFPRRVEKVAEVWRGKCARLEEEHNRLREEVLRWQEKSQAYQDVHDAVVKDNERLSKELDTVRSVCAEAYQMAGALGATAEALDNLLAAANGTPLPHATFLPILTAPSVPDGLKEAADHIIDFLQSQYDTEGITENDSGDALIRLSGAIAAVEEVLLAAAPKPGEWK